jgi:hypothetical protein
VDLEKNKENCVMRDLIILFTVYYYDNKVTDREWGVN